MQQGFPDNQPPSITPPFRLAFATHSREQYFRLGLPKLWNSFPQHGQQKVYTALCWISSLWLFQKRIRQASEQNWRGFACGMRWMGFPQPRQKACISSAASTLCLRQYAFMVLAEIPVNDAIFLYPSPCCCKLETIWISSVVIQNTSIAVISFYGEKEPVLTTLFRRTWKQMHKKIALRERIPEGK